jgi:hypothetical protein
MCLLTSIMDHYYYIISILPQFYDFLIISWNFFNNVMFYRCLSFCLFLLSIMLSVLRFTDSDYPFGIFKLFLQQEQSFFISLITIAVIVFISLISIAVIVFCLLTYNRCNRFCLLNYNRSNRFWDKNYYSYCN